MHRIIKNNHNNTLRQRRKKLIRIDNKIKAWEGAGLISSSQASKIIEFENTTKQPKLTMALVFLGIFVICSGIVSLIAANWDEIFGWLKLSIDFAILTTLTAATYYAYCQDKKGWFEGGLVGIFLMTGASIILIAQVFQLHSNIANGFLAWAFFTSPLIILSKNKLISFIWIPVLLFSFLVKIEIWELIDRLFSYFEFLRYSPATVTGFLLTFFALAAFASKSANEYFKNQQPIFSVLKIYMIQLMYIAAIYGFIYALFIMEAYMAYSSLKNLKYINFNVNYIPSFLLTISFFSAMVWINYKQNKIKQVNTNIILIGAAFFAVYIRLFGNLISTGFGLIISGLVILVICGLINFAIKKSKALKGAK